MIIVTCKIGFPVSASRKFTANGRKRVPLLGIDMPPKSGAVAMPASEKQHELKNSKEFLRLEKRASYLRRQGRQGSLHLDKTDQASAVGGIGSHIV